MLTSWDRDVVRHLLRLAFASLLRRITGETDLQLRERLAFAGNAVRDAARWLVQGADPAMILFSLKEVAIEDSSPEADSHIEAIRLTCHKAIAINRRRVNAVSGAATQDEKQQENWNGDTQQPQQDPANLASFTSSVRHARHHLEDLDFRTQPWVETR